MTKRDANNILNMDISEDGKMVRIVRDMCHPAGRVPAHVKDDMRNESFVQLFVVKMIICGTPQQKAMLIKLFNMGWILRKIVWNERDQKIAFSVYLDDCAAWVTPDGKLERAAVGKRTAYLDRNWTDLA